MAGFSIEDTIRGIGQELRRTQLRARNGLRLLVGSEPARVAPTAKDEVWSLGKARLYRYRSDRVRRAPPLLLFLGLVGRPYVLDLYPGNSIVEKLIEDGHDVFLLDWGLPDAAEGEHSIDTYLDDYLRPAMDVVVRTAGSGGLTVIGYCMGALMAVMLAGSTTDTPISRMGLLTPPCDFRHGPAIFQLLRSGGIRADDVIDPTTGVVPAKVLDSFFKLRRPTSDIVSYVSLWENLWDDEYVHAHRATTTWMWDLVPMAGAAFRQFGEIVRDNAVLTGEARVNGRRVELDTISVPALVLIAQRDDLVPAACSEPLPGLLGSADIERVDVPAGHAGAFMGRASIKVTAVAIVDWLGRHSSPA